MAEVQAAVRVTVPESAEMLDVFGANLAVLGDTTGLPLMIGTHVIPPGYSVPPHSHAHDDEVFVMLEGELTVIGPEGEVHIGPGAIVELPRDVPHSFRNASDAPARLLVMLLPGRQALEMFRHFDRVGKGPAPFAPADVPTIAAQYGVSFV